MSISDIKESTPNKYNGLFSATRYKTFEKYIDTVLRDNLENKELIDTLHESIMKSLCQSMNYDPNLPSYSVEKVARIKAETGKSYYEVCQKAHREKNIEEYRRKTAERTRLYYQRKRERLAEEKRKQDEELLASQEKVDE